MPLRSILQRPPITIDEEADAKKSAHGRVIVIDDDAGLRDAFSELLSLEGYACECFGSGLEFLASLAEAEPVFGGPCCVVCDVKMPGMDGLALQQRLLDEQDTPFILMSGLSGAEEASSAFRAGAFDFLVKPISAADFLTVIERALNRSRTAQQQQVLDHDLSRRVDLLTSRELQVVREVVTGRTNQEIASSMNIALRTVKLYRQRAMEKLEAASLADLVRLADAAGL